MSREEILAVHTQGSEAVVAVVDRPYQRCYWRRYSALLAAGAAAESPPAPRGTRQGRVCGGRGREPPGGKLLSGGRGTAPRCCAS